MSLPCSKLFKVFTKGNCELCSILLWGLNEKENKNEIEKKQKDH